MSRFRGSFPLWKLKSSTWPNSSKCLPSLKRTWKISATSWVQAGEEAIQLWLARRIKPVMQSYKRDPSHLIGPGYSLAILLGSMQRNTSVETDGLLNLSKVQPPEDATACFRKRLEWVDEHLSHSVLRRGLPFSFVERTKKTINGERRFESLGENFLNAVTLHIVEPPLPAFRLFKTFQWVSYLMLLGVLLIAVGGEKAWLNVLKEFGVSSVHPASHFHHQHPFQR